MAGAPEREEFDRLLADVRGARVAVVGDFCLDVYWFVDRSAAEPSLETGLETRPVRGQRYSLGGAGNVVENLASLECGTLFAVGVVGCDPWGREMLRSLNDTGADTRGMVTRGENWETLAYVKPYVGDTELNRIDFGNFNRLPECVAREVAERLDEIVRQVDVVIVNEQVERGLHTPLFREELDALMRRHPQTTFLVDSRHFPDAYPAACCKVNDHEAARRVGKQRQPEEMVLREEVLQAAQKMFGATRKPVFVTRGPRGCVVCDERGIHEVPGIQITGRVDPVGAGDSLLAGIALGLATGREPTTAARFGNLVASVTARKLFQTGVATPLEVRKASEAPDYVFRPEAADDPRRARYHGDTDMEIVTGAPAGFRPAHAIFDHDGTLSTLRQGWEEVMQPMMVREILGPRFEEADESLYARVVDRVRAYIDQTTGVQTITQMQGLVDLVREFGCVPEPKIRDATGYKQVYNEALMYKVRSRLAKLERGELDVRDFTIKGAPEFLQALHQGGVRLYLASGTDEEDVRAEAQALGYAHLFAGGIFGARADTTVEAKRVVLDRILDEVGEAARAGLVTFGDGPVEIRETVRRGGLAMGVASDEVRRFGLNARKRARLIRAGADLVVPDYAQASELLKLLGMRRVAEALP